ncbi:HlyD family efflux transporter periplasmic adaptor subunit [Oryzibacter oryziterrae]|uniref:HlyD family efflux transporter periplasmic adaptor subunit n=1 Tax=Oryzibacter oryziterrae TaxID=2766474 RepID=UPI001F2B4F91|nr:HlyD family efflux transporter periplasmic adaptor subunit [Oryzibacter oryziterrae]
MRASKAEKQATSQDQEVERLISVFESEQGEIRAARGPFGASVAIVLLFSLMVALFVLTTLVQIDRVVGPVSGQIVSPKPAVTLVAVETGPLGTLNVSEGQHVQRGQVLATLDTTFIDADRTALEIRIAGLRAQLARIEAELNDGQLSTASASSDPQQAKALALQSELLGSRRAESAIVKKTFDTQRELLQGAVEQLAGQPRDDAERKLTLFVGEHDLALERQRAALREERLAAQQSLDDAEQQAAKVIRHADLLRLVAPDDGMITFVSKKPVGALIAQQEALVTLQPDVAEPEVDVSILPRDIGYVQVGDKVRIKLDAFEYAEHGALVGRVRSISGVPTEAPGAPAVYKVRIELAQTDLYDMPAGFEFKPGMTLTADINVGTRSLLRYMLKGFVRTGSEAFREAD